jgi:hypothetical protein
MVEVEPLKSSGGCTADKKKTSQQSFSTAVKSPGIWIRVLSVIPSDAIEVDKICMTKSHEIETNWQRKHSQKLFVPVIHQTKEQKVDTKI